MLSNAYFLAKFRFDTVENEPAKNLQNFRKMHNATRGSRAADDLRVLLRVVLLGLRVLEVEVHVAVVVVVLLSEGRPVPAQMSSNVIKRYQILSGLQFTLPNLFWKCWQNAALFRLYRHRYSQVTSHVAALIC